MGFIVCGIPDYATGRDEDLLRWTDSWGGGLHPLQDPSIWEGIKLCDAVPASLFGLRFSYQ